MLEVQLDRDLESRDPGMPHDLRRALQARPAARKIYDRASSALRREIGNWVAGARRTETRERRIETALDNLEARALRPKSDFGTTKRK